jgi:DNA-binding transcriptional LysR family regulator
VQIERGPEFDNIETIKQAVEIGAGVALLPAPTVERERAAGTLVVVNIDGEEIVRPLGILHRRHGELSAAAKEFIDMLTAAGAAEESGPDGTGLVDHGAPSPNGIASPWGS